MKIKANSFFKVLIILTVFFASVSFVGAQESAEETDSYSSASNNMRGQTSAFMHFSGLQQSVKAENIAGSIIKTALSLLGIIFVVLIIFSGYQWMTAGGNEESVKGAQSRIKNAVIGLVIVVMAYAITAFIFKNLPGGSNQVETTDPQNS